MLVADLDAVSREHLARALDVHVRWCATNAIPVPRDVRAMRVALSVSNGQERTEVAGGLADGDDLGGLKGARLLTPDQVARRLGLSSRSVRRLVGSGELPSVKIGGARRVDPVDVSEFIETRKRKKVRSAG
jgi:excisionase family DNA binding protein